MSLGLPLGNLLSKIFSVEIIVHIINTHKTVVVVFFFFNLKRHPEGVAQINFKEPDAADACVQLFNNRWFGQRKITAETWDGKTKYKCV